MKAKFSPYLSGIADGIKELIAELKKSYDYVSVLSTDSVGFTVSVSQRSKSIQGKTMMTERTTMAKG